ncbi:arginine ABC transporter permease ArtM [Plesiomonas shigelloides subsp. oncorhynchi]|uniref:Arginine ABC transporter permease protein ArtM n=2 Tax=Plesiomonas shigelloides TaxID=703 RepID=R8ANW7_PLESH|nr:MULTISPECIES: arginine ABC transporter permease ArtM [Plesiomonas]MDO4687585.1 arginine ABC transporter permease ArtM [Plesiomonas sp.]EON88052.1 Arginine ABC transporter, permease protein ArtM [Plesiomonas shigelloides 302-73]MBO1107095.1 arginine ABC transporter permease ArtM [Plesiomonas shigelloides]MCE5163083.1 arginine ABC transporter permease ArtM [Plesiomonas sp. PI-19]MCQ8858016.1 arginine ABC transporter permease ArtM [Plesiomonas shigelloides]
MWDYLPTLLQGLQTSLSLTVCALLIGFTLAVVMTVIMAGRKGPLRWLTKGYLTLFTGTPLLIQIFLIYYGPGQFESLRNSVLWPLLSEPWFCAMLALALNSAAYSTLLFYGAVKAIPAGQWQSCSALGMTRLQTLRILVPYALKRSLPAYSNEVVLIFKGTSLASTITIMDIMGYAQQLNAQTYDTLAVFGMAGVIYLVVNGLLTILMRQMEKRMLAFEQRC